MRFKAALVYKADKTSDAWHEDILDLEMMVDYHLRTKSTIQVSIFAEVQSNGRKTYLQHLATLFGHTVVQCGESNHAFVPNCPDCKDCGVMQGVWLAEKDRRANEKISQELVKLEDSE